MSSPADAFGDFEGRTWLNAAHQGPLPRAAAETARRAVADKEAPHRIADAAFEETPRRVRRALATLVGGREEEVVLANSTSFGLDLLARGLPLREGDEVLLAENEFPATVFPWLWLEERGVLLRFLPTPTGRLEADDVRAAIGPRTRVVCVSWVFSFTGATTDVAALADVCGGPGGPVLVVNGSQAVGARAVDVRALGVDALVSCGFKWLCGPYATGFAWLSSEVVSALEHRQGYWLAQVDEIGDPPERYALRPDLGAAGHDVFCPANLSTYPAWATALDLLLDVGAAAIERHDQELVQRLVDALPAGWSVRSPQDPARRSTLVFLEGEDAGRTREGFERLGREGVDVAMRAGRLRVSPHLYNTAADIDRLIDVLSA